MLLERSHCLGDLLPAHLGVAIEFFGDKDTIRSVVSIIHIEPFQGCAPVPWTSGHAPP